MTPQEIELIRGVADRLRNANLTEKDAEAEAFIKNEIGAQPNSTYILTQAVILQEYALKQAQTQIDNLKKQVNEARGQGGPSQQPAGASFLGGLFGGGDQPAPSSAPPRSAAKPARKNPWGSPAPSSLSAAGAGGGAGSFMRSAGSIALGVAGGALLANALQGMLADEEGAEEQVADDGALGDTEATGDEHLADTTDLGEEFEDPGQDLADDSSLDEDSDFGGGDFGDDDWS